MLSTIQKIPNYNARQWNEIRLKFNSNFFGIKSDIYSELQLQGEEQSVCLVLNIALLHMPNFIDFIYDGDYIHNTLFSQVVSDKTCNCNGTKLLSLCKSTSIHILNTKLCFLSRCISYWSSVNKLSNNFADIVRDVNDPLIKKKFQI